MCVDGIFTSKTVQLVLGGWAALARDFGANREVFASLAENPSSIRAALAPALLLKICQNGPGNRYLSLHVSHGRFCQ